MLAWGLSVPIIRRVPRWAVSVVVVKQSGHVHCLSDVIRWRSLRTHTCLFMAMTDSCSSSSSSSNEEEHSILPGAVAVLQQIDEKNQRLKKRKIWWVSPWIAWVHVLVKEVKVADARAYANFIWMDVQQFLYLLDTVSPLIVHKDTAMRNAVLVTCWAQH